MAVKTANGTQAKVDLSVSVGSLKLKNPIMVASGTFGGVFDKILDVDKLGGIVLKTVTLQLRKGNPTPRIVETPSGIINSIGLENKGLDGFIKEELPHYSKFKTKLVVSISGKDVDEYKILAGRLSVYNRIDALELNISCPNVTKGGMDCATNPDMTRQIVGTVKKLSPFPVIAKLTPNVTDVAVIAKAAIEGGADIISLVNTIKALAVDWRRRRPILGAVTGGLSGPAIKPVALRFVWEVASKFNIPVIGIGGISTAEDVLEFMCAGASAVQVGTLNFVDCTATTKIISQLPSLLASQNITRISDLIGTFDVKYTNKVNQTGG